MKRVFSGIQPTGTIHVGNYAGAIRNWVRLQEQYECIYCIVDYHAITIPYEPKELPLRVFEAALDILACGVDPERATLMVQSQVPEQAELTAAPRIMALNDPARKMSKSIPGSFISLDDDADAIRKKIARAVTDVGPAAGEMGPGVKNLFTLLEVFGPPETLAHFRTAYAAGNLKYSELKPALAEDVVAVLEPIRARRAALQSDPDRVRDILATSARHARDIAGRTMEEVRARMGL